MDISSFSEHIVSVPYKRGKETVELQVNIDAFTPEFFRLQKDRAKDKLVQMQREIQRLKKEDAAKRKTKQKKLTVVRRAEQEFERKAQESLDRLEQRAQESEAERQSFAELLSSNVLKGWDVTENGIPIEPSKEVLMRLPPRGLEDLWNKCVEAAQTVKKPKTAETSDSQTTSETSDVGTQPLRVVGGQNM